MFISNKILMSSTFFNILLIPITSHKLHCHMMVHVTSWPSWITAIVSNCASWFCSCPVQDRFLNGCEAAQFSIPLLLHFSRITLERVGNATSTPKEWNCIGQPGLGSTPSQKQVSLTSLAAQSVMCSLRHINQGGLFADILHMWYKWVMCSWDSIHSWQLCWFLEEGLVIIPKLQLSLAAYL